MKEISNQHNMNQPDEPIWEKLSTFLSLEDKIEGFTQEEIESAESTLNVKLPADLVKIYRKYGKCKSFSFHDRLLAPKDLIIKNEYLIFFTENQGVHNWAFNIVGLENNDFQIYGIDDFGVIRKCDVSIVFFFLKHSFHYLKEKLFSMKFKTNTTKTIEPFINIFGPPKSIEYLPFDRKVVWYYHPDCGFAIFVSKKDKDFDLSIHTNYYEMLKHIEQYSVSEWTIVFSNSRKRIQGRPTEKVYQEKNRETEKVKKIIESLDELPFDWKEDLKD